MNAHVDTDAIRRFEQHNTELKALLEAANAKVQDLDGKNADLRARLTGLEQEFVGLRDGRRGRGLGAMETAGHAVASSDAFKSFGGSATKGKFTVKVKSITSGASSAGALVAPDYRPEIVGLPQRRLVVRDLIAPGNTNSNMIQYPRQTLRDLNARIVSEGAEKPESNIEFELENAPVVTIAHWTRASKLILDDAPQLTSIVDGELRYGLEIVEEEEILMGDGTSLHLAGIVPQAIAFSPPFETEHTNDFDVLLQAMAQSQQALLPATGIVINDIRLMKMRTVKNQDGDYIVSGGPFGGPVTSIWGVPTVGTPVIGYDEFLVGAFRDGAQVWDRQEATVEASTEDGDNFRRNLVTVRGEERLAFAVKRPQAFVHGEFTHASG